MGAPEAMSIHCRRCGGRFGFVPYPGNARCPYCAFEQPVSAEFIEELRRYASNVSLELARADDAYRRAATWQQWSDQSKQAIPRLKLVIPLVSALTLLAAIAIPITQELGIPPAQVSVVVTPLFVLPGIFLMGYVFWAYAGKGARAERAVAGRVRVACPNCGAMGELLAGAAAQVCGYCRAALVASRPVMAQGLDAAELAHRNARLVEFRQERAGTLALMRYDMSSYVPFIVGGSLLFPLGGGTCVLTAGILSGQEPYHPGIFLMWAMLLGVIGGLAGVLLRRRSRHAQYQAALADLGLQFPLSPFADVHGVGAWLNRYWPAKYDLKALTAGTSFFAASIDALGYPALLNADFTSGEHRDPRLHLLLAAQHRQHAVSPEATAYVRQALGHCRALGFEVSSCEAGLVGTADADTVRIVARNPAALHELSHVLTTMAQAARAAGSVPADA